MAFFKGEIYSYSLGKMTPLSVYLPIDDNKRFGVERPMKTLVLLHGLGGDYSYWARFSSVERYAQKHNLALIMPDAQMSMYANMECGQDYEDYIAIELKEILNSLFKVKTDRDNYFIAGLSMGGYGAVKIALKHPDIFGRCASFSGALMIGQKENLENLAQWKDLGVPKHYDENYELNREFYQGCKGAFGESFKYKKDEDLVYLTRDVKQSGWPIPKILLTCGTEDFLYPDNKRYCSVLDECKIKYEFHEWSGVHEWKFWDESIRDYIGFFD